MNIQILFYLISVVFLILSIIEFKNYFEKYVEIKEYKNSKSNELKDVNIKFFNNNSIQISGLKSIFHCNYALNKLLLCENVSRIQLKLYCKFLLTMIDIFSCSVICHFCLARQMEK